MPVFQICLYKHLALFTGVTPKAFVMNVRHFGHTAKAVLFLADLAYGACTVQTQHSASQDLQGSM